MEDEVVIRQSFLKQLLLTVLGIIMVLCSLFVVVVFLRESFFILLIGVTGVLFCGTCLVFTIMHLIMPKTILTINSYGFINNSAAISIGKMVYWNQVEDITILSTPSQKFISVKLKNPNEFLQELTPMQKILRKLNLIFSFDITQINLISTTAKYEEVIKIMNNYLSAYSSRNT